MAKEKIPADLVINWDQTPLHYIPASKWTMEAEGTSKVPIAGGSDKRALTAIFTVTLSGNFLPMQLIYTGKTAQSLPKFSFPDGFSLTQNPSHWSNEDTMELYVEEILAPYIKMKREQLEIPDTPALLIYDAFMAHTTEGIQNKLRELNVRLFSHWTYLSINLLKTTSSADTQNGIQNMLYDLKKKENAAMSS